MAQPTPLAGAPELAETLDRLNTLGSLLILGAHPDDENTNVIAYFARGRHIRTAYLSATRGEGGQNLIGSEQAELMGVIRTQELLAARRIDGGEQFFTRAIDFGYSKSHEEALEKWGRERVLGDLVRIIRRFRPDVIVTRFAADSSGGHGHHNAVGHLAPEAFEAAGDETRFTEQFAEGLRPWKARRLYWNTFSFTRRFEQAEAQREDRLQIDAGQYDPLLGKSYAEVAGESRSLHRSQSMGTPQRKGPVPAFFAYVAGDRAEEDLFEDIDTTWSRVAGGAEVGQLLRQARADYRPEQPELLLPVLLRAHAALRTLNDPWVSIKKAELLRAIELAAGFWLDAAADRWDAAPGSALTVKLSAVNRSGFPLLWTGAEIDGVARAAAKAPEGTWAKNEVAETGVSVAIPEQASYTQPYWLAKPAEGEFYRVEDPAKVGDPESDAALVATFHLRTQDGMEFAIQKPVAFRWVDEAAGERTRRLQIVPKVAVSVSQPNLIFPDTAARQVNVQLESFTETAQGVVSLEVPPGWKALPVEVPVEISRRGQQVTVAFEIHPPPGTSSGWARAGLKLGGSTITAGVRTIEYPHIPLQTVFPDAVIRLERVDVNLLSKKIGYVMGAGDNIPQALEQIGASVQVLSAADLAALDLTPFDAIVTGIRALNTRPDLLAAEERVLDYVKAGGTLLVQYNTVSRGPRDSPTLAPYPLEASRDRVSVEEAPVSFLAPDHPVLREPNRITKEDFEGWVQERGLYFMSGWDERYEAVIACHDPGEPPQPGGLLYARYGKGIYIFTGYSWFRQLPAGVPGAYRIFANLVSARQTP